MLKWAGRFYIKVSELGMGSKRPFGKSFHSPADLVRLLESRGLFIGDRQQAEHILTHTSYYRLSAYMYPFLAPPKEHHIYKPDASFLQVIRLYKFDKELRSLIFNGIEKIEVSFRCALINAGCEDTRDPFWMTDFSNFIDPVKFQKTTALLKSEFTHSHEDYVKHFKAQYSDPFPPAWMMSELAPLGSMTSVYVNLRNQKTKKKIAQSFGLHIKPFESWMTIITLTRNACCHHARVWNKQNTIRPMMPSTMVRPWISLPTDPMRVYFDLCIIRFFLNVISPDNDFKGKLTALLLLYPDIDIQAMGFPLGWETEPLWQ